MIFVIDDDAIMAKCVARACRQKCRIFDNAITAIRAFDEEVPNLIFLDILLNGPDGFTFLNELASYSDTAKIPIVIVSSLKFKAEDLADYGVVGVLDKDTMLPEEIKKYVENYAK